MKGVGKEMADCMDDEHGRRRGVIQRVQLDIDGGTFPIMRTVREHVVVEADIFADGHDALSALLQYRHEAHQQWTDTPMEFRGDDRHSASLPLTTDGSYIYKVYA